MVASIGHYVGNKLVAGRSGRTGDITNPATGEVTAEVAFASEAEIDEAVQVAKKAQLAWAATPPLRRQRVMFNLKFLIEKRIDDLARHLSLEHGKTFDDAKGEVGRGLEVVEFACGNAFILKPSERDPSCPMRLAELFLEAGLPAGIFNVVNGDKEAVD
ncbi:MAG: aldehyde dehydrogenase family protein, partial [Alphaproteobacteria bacterium]|nr:aldehyde dehydrogenase family protein [Alphaproteobacteria bacterium]